MTIKKTRGRPRKKQPVDETEELKENEESSSLSSNFGDETAQILSSAAKPKNPSSQEVIIDSQQQVQPQQSAPYIQSLIRKKILYDCRSIHSL
jgi:hypothetical protein